MLRRTLLPIPFAISLAVIAACGSDNNSPASPSVNAASALTSQDALVTKTPIKHVVVIFGENRSFDHYFGTYPKAQNPAGEPSFVAAAGTPVPNNLNQLNLLTDNPNFINASVNNSAVAGSAKNPFRIDRSQANTNGQSHDYHNEELAYDDGKADAFPKYTGNNNVGSGTTFGTPGLVMGYFDGNTVTAEWNYAQHFAMSDNMYTDTYGPSTPGALEVVSGQTNGIVPANGAVQGDNVIADGAGGFTMNGDSDPTGDICNTSTSTGQASFSTSANKNIGDLLNAKGITWGGFMGGFDTTAVNPNGSTGCTRTSYSDVLATTVTDYIPHHNWFQYYATTQNLAHTRPTSTALIGQTDPKDATATPVHHEYDVNDFFAAVKAGNFPSVSYIKAPAVGDAHPGNSDPIDEQAFDTKVINFLMQQPDWKNTAVFLTYDDSDGWYDHAYATPTTSSFSTEDALTGTASCDATGATQGVGVTGALVNGRCGPGTRIPFILISPYAKSNYIDHTRITQASVVQFIEDNWLGGTRLGGGSHDATTGSVMSLFDFTNGGSNTALFVDPNTGLTLASAPSNS